MQTGNSSQYGGYVTCTMNRQWQTIYSDIILTDWTLLTGQFGFKVYNNSGTTVPFPKGFVKDFQMLVIDAASALSAVLAISLLAAAV